MRDLNFLYTSTQTPFLTLALLPPRSDSNVSAPLMLSPGPDATMEELRRAWEEAEESSLKDRTTFGAEAPRSYQFKYVKEEMKEGVSGSASSQAHLVDGQSIPDKFAEGVRLFESGSLRPACHCFESVLKSSPQHAPSWRYLGLSHQELDADEDAIICLEHAVASDPYDLDSLLSLGVSYVNEMDISRMGRSLTAWVAGNGTYGALAGDWPGGAGAVEDLLRRARERDQNDPQVLEALGVVYNAARKVREEREKGWPLTRVSRGEQH